MAQVCDQNDDDSPDPKNDHYCEVHDDLETEVFDNNEKKDVVQFFSTVFKDAIEPLFDPKLPEMLTIDCTDPFFVIRFLQSIYTNYLDYVNKNSGNLITEILDKCRPWNGGDAVDYKQHLGDIQVMVAKLSSERRSICDQKLIINLVISNLMSDSDLKAVHTVLRMEHN
jgi:hypothetical protein